MQGGNFRDRGTRFVVPAELPNRTTLHVGQSPFVPAAFTVGDADAINAKD
jgi:hypothetical protein